MPDRVQEDDWRPARRVATHEVDARPVGDFDDWHGDVPFCAPLIWKFQQPFPHWGLGRRIDLPYVATMDTQFRVTDRAASRIAEILASEGAGALRVAVLAGGCSGFQYKFDLEPQPATADDLVIERDGARVLVDTTSLDLLAGSELDFKDALMGSHFAVSNPQATSSCGCGTSFSID